MCLLVAFTMHSLVLLHFKQRQSNTVQMDGCSIFVPLLAENCYRLFVPMAQVIDLALGHITWHGRSVACPQFGNSLCPFQSPLDVCTVVWRIALFQQTAKPWKRQLDDITTMFGGVQGCGTYR